jgi:hypothetical protein
MPRFYFHIQSGKEITRDDEGNECADVAAARKEALAIAREILIEAIRGSKDEIADAFIIADANEREIMTVAVREVLPKSLRGY